MNQAKRYAVWTVAGWLGIVFGGIGLLTSAGMFLLFLLFAVGSYIESSHKPSYGQAPLLPGLLVGVLPLLGVVIAALAVGAGIGLIRRRPYGRTLTLVFGALSIVGAVGSTVDVWQNAMSHAVNGPSLATRLLRIIIVTPMNVGYILAMALLCRSVYLNRASFSATLSRNTPSTR